MQLDYTAIMMNRIIPWELANKIYKNRANILLLNKLNEYHIDSEKFFNFLKNYNAFLMGSFCLSCFDNTWTPNDIDIFVTNPDGENRCVYKDFCKTINKTCIPIKIGKHPLANSSIDDNTPQYLYKIQIFDKIIDIIILEPNQLNIFNYLTINCSNIIFDGTNWNFPSNIDDIGKFLITKKCTIGCEPYSSYFSDIYDPYKYNIYNSLIESSSYFTLSRNHSISDDLMRNIYEKLVVYYPESNTREYRTECCHIAKYQILESYDLVEDDFSNNFSDVNDEYNFNNCGDVESDCDEFNEFDEFDNYNLRSKNDVDIGFDRSVICPDNYLNVSSFVFKNFNESQKMKCSTFIKLYCVYRTWYRILKYISRGYQFTDINQLMEQEFTVNEIKSYFKSV